MTDIKHLEDDALDLEEFLITIEAVHSTPDQFSKRDMAVMLWKVEQIIGQLLAAFVEENEDPSGDMSDMYRKVAPYCKG